MRATHLPTAARHCSSEIGMSPAQTEEEDKVERGHPLFVNPVTDSTNQLGQQEGKLPSIRGSTVWETFTGTVPTHHSCVQGTGTGSGCTEWGNDGHKVGQTTTSLRASRGSSFRYQWVAGPTSRGRGRMA